MVLVQDAARPFITNAMIVGSIAFAKRFGGCIVAVPESDTVKVVDGDLFIKKTLPRRQIFRTQTPQVFRRDLLAKAYAKRGHTVTTDYAHLLEMIGEKVKILPGSYRNIKITTAEDLKVAETFL
jgi:2-C-methyl-D-erythritol 4-phosphate cytidylyltransferase